MSRQVRKKILKKFKIRGYTLRIDALDEVLSFAVQFPDAEDDAIDLLLDNLQNESLKSSIVDKEPIQRVIGSLLEANDATEETSTFASACISGGATFQVTDAFLVPRFRYNPVTKQFHEYTDSLLKHGDASAKMGLYKDRFLLLSQRVSRDEHFSRPTFDTEMSDYENCEISPIQSLVVRRGRRWVMGLISQLEDGHFYLEDLTATVEIDLANAKITTGFFIENTIIVAEGEMQLNGIFKVNTCGFPPLEDRNKSLKVHTGHDFFGSGTITKEETLRLADLESNAVNEMFVILSDIWLDNDEVLGKLETVLDGFANVEVVPSLIVFMGNFCSRPCNLSFNSYSSLRAQFGKLGKMIGAHPQLKENTRFLFVPGPDDIGPSKVLPRCALPSYLTEELREVIPNAIFSSNPCRVKFFNQEIVFFRQDLLYKMRRSCLVTPSTEESEDPFHHLVYTIIHQSHLCPLPLMVQPIIWNFDHALHLYPTPHTIVLGDKSEQKTFKFGETTCFNPGSFSTDSTFVVYRPCKQEVELSVL